MIKNMDNYGKELILDLHNCNSSLFTRDILDLFFKELCELIDMQQCERFFWDDHGLPPDECQTLPHTKGITAVQFILTSNITIHTLDILERVYLNIFSCKDFDEEIAISYCSKFFSGDIKNNQVLRRV